MIGFDCAFTNYKGSSPVVCPLSSILAGRLLHVLAAASGTQQECAAPQYSCQVLSVELTKTER
jgi:hypothetical protein